MSSLNYPHQAIF